MTYDEYARNQRDALTESSLAHKRVVADKIVRDCLKTGSFTLKSGAKSDYYLDLKKLTLSTFVYRVASIIITELFLNNKIGDLGINAIAGPSIGADPIVGAVLAHGFSGITHGGMVRPASKDHGISGRVAGPINENSRVLAIEDVTTTGDSLKDCIQALWIDSGCAVCVAMTIVDRSGGRAAKLFEEIGVPFVALFQVEDLLKLKGEIHG